MTRYSVSAANESGTAGEGPFVFTAESADAARERYVEWAYATYGDAYEGPALEGLHAGGPLSVITVEPIPE